MRDEGMQVSPQLVKQNLRSLLGGFISKHALGQFLDFNVVVIPTGKHVKEFPTADAAFHPFIKSGESAESQLVIRIVPWLIAKISANSGLSQKLHNEAHNFWKAGVEQMWEICLWNRTVLLHTADGKIKKFEESEFIDKCEVLPGFSLPVAALFEGGATASLLPDAAEERNNSWLIDQSLRTRGRKLKKQQTPGFVMASPEQLQAAAAVGEHEQYQAPGSASRLLFEMLFHTWPGRMGILLVASILTTMVVLMIAENTGEKSAPTLDTSAKKQTLVPAAGIKRDLARSTVAAYYKAADVDSRIALVRNPDETGPMIKSHYDTHPLHSQPVRHFGEMEDISLGGTQFLKLLVWLEEGSHDVFLEDLGADGYRIDWPSLAGHNPTSYTEFTLEKNAVQEVAFRVLASDGGFHGGRFDNPEKFMSIVLNFPNTEKRLYGYVRHRSTLAPVLKKLVEDQYKRRIRLRLRWPTEADFENDPVTDDSLITDSDREMTAQLKGRQVWITALDGDTWLSPDP